MAVELLPELPRVSHARGPINVTAGAFPPMGVGAFAKTSASGQPAIKPSRAGGPRPVRTFPSRRGMHAAAAHH